MKAEEIEFEETCGYCPEAYRLMHNGEEVGYLRLRGGYLCLTAGRYTSVFANDRDETIDVWDHQFENDPYKGGFDDEYERREFKQIAVDKLIEYYERETN
jgi:hypothetical protein